MSSPWKLLSPVNWARWTWSAVQTGGAFGAHLVQKVSSRGSEPSPDELESEPGQQILSPDGEGGGYQGREFWADAADPSLDDDSEDGGGRVGDLSDQELPSDSECFDTDQADETLKPSRLNLDGPQEQDCEPPATCVKGSETPRSDQPLNGVEAAESQSESTESETLVSDGTLRTEEIDEVLSQGSESAAAREGSEEDMSTGYSPSLGSAKPCGDVSKGKNKSPEKSATRLGVKKPSRFSADQKSDSNLITAGNGPQIKGNYMMDFSKLEDSNFNPFATTSQLPGSPVPMKATQSFDTGGHCDASDLLAASAKLPGVPLHRESPDGGDVAGGGSEAESGDGEDGSSKSSQKKKKRAVIKSRATFRVKNRFRNASTSDNAQDPALDLDADAAMAALATDEEKMQRASSATAANATAFSLDGHSAETTPGAPDAARQDEAVLCAARNGNLSPAPGKRAEASGAPAMPSGGQMLEIDYLEQFGMSGFTESDLRKQSLFVKFDPLLADDPKALPRPVTKRRQNDRPSEEAAESGQSVAGAIATAKVDLLSVSPDKVLQCLERVASTPAALDGDTIVEVLKYSQRDMDTALKAARDKNVTVDQEATVWKEKCREAEEKLEAMRKLLKEYEVAMAQMMDDEQRGKAAFERTVQQLTSEKDQALADLNSVEKSLSELFKRYEKMKKVMEGFKQNEEVLKKYAHDAQIRLKKEEQKYQALKAHAEEKINKANEDIAHVRNKARTECLALDASLRKEQMKVQSLEVSLKQKIHDKEELTRICDELISKMGKS
uniref:Transforming acidic coiled-coil-containing protein 3-like isoform X3 n=1 Tax=Petromyzon marinus TaxID=7757 RepID=A0AAJ7WQP3_PETMA|nr:transforming acidic coiled-coil-containing protein 3-like isoform X3 [Petromyzon marinus]